MVPTHLMAVNPYAAPGAPVKDRDEAGFKFSIALVGMLIAIGAAYVLELFYKTLAEWPLLGRGVALDVVAAASRQWR